MRKGYIRVLIVLGVMLFVSMIYIKSPYYKLASAKQDLQNYAQETTEFIETPDDKIGEQESKITKIKDPLQRSQEIWALAGKVSLYGNDPQRSMEILKRLVPDPSFDNTEDGLRMVPTNSYLIASAFFKKGDLDNAKRFTEKAINIRFEENFDGSFGIYGAGLVRLMAALDLEKEIEEIFLTGDGSVSDFDYKTDMACGYLDSKSQEKFQDFYNGLKLERSKLLAEIELDQLVQKVEANWTFLQNCRFDAALINQDFISARNILENEALDFSSSIFSIEAALKNISKEKNKAVEVETRALLEYYLGRLSRDEKSELAKLIEDYNLKYLAESVPD